MSLYIGGFSRFVNFATTPSAMGWNDNCPAEFAPDGKPCLRTAHEKFHVISWALYLPLASCTRTDLDGGVFTHDYENRIRHSPRWQVID